MGSARSFLSFRQFLAHVGESGILFFFQLSILLTKVGFRLFFGLTFRFIWLSIAHSLSLPKATVRQANC
jgi:hypothetical protein